MVKHLHVDHLGITTTTVELRYLELVYLELPATSETRVEYMIAFVNFQDM